MDKYDLKKFTKINRLMLRIVGLWPKGNKGYKLELYTVYTTASLIIFQLGHVATQVIDIFYIFSDIEAATGSIFIMMEDALAVFKFCCFMKNIKMLKQLVDHSIFQPRNTRQMLIAEYNAKFWTLLYTTLWVTSSGCMVFWTLFPILSGGYKHYRLPFFAWYPYNVKQSPLYEITYFYQLFSTAFMIVGNVNMDGFVAALNMYTTTQYEILCDELRSLCLVEHGVDNNSKLVDCIEKHKRIVSFAENINKSISWIILLQLFTGALVVGLSMFQLTIVAPFSSQFYSFLFYTSAITFEVLTYCWFGNGVATASDKVCYALLESDWVGATSSVQQNMAFFMTNCQKPFKFSAFGIIYLSLETFMAIMKTAWSYFCLLRNVNS